MSNLGMIELLDERWAKERNCFKFKIDVLGRFALYAVTF